MILSLVAYVCCGAVAGVLAGLLGVGGGIVLVPMMVAIFPSVGVPAQYVQQMALGTSLASIMVTSVSSARAPREISTMRGLLTAPSCQRFSAKARTM